MFANRALFAAAPLFLEDPVVAPFTRSLIHSEQSYQWLRPLPAGEVLAVSGRVEGVRARGPLHLVTFSIEAGGDGGLWLEGSAVFLMSREAAASGEDATEPAVDLRPTVGPPEAGADVPPVGSDLPELACGASRADLVRYAAATGDWNPIHWDHESARSAGLDGVIVHGLLMAAWINRVAQRYGDMASTRLRFRKPLRPATSATVVGTVVGQDKSQAEFDLALQVSGDRLVTARSAVTR